MIDKVKRRNLIKEKMELEKRREEAFLDYMEKVKMVVNTTSYHFLLKSLEHEDDDSLSKYEVEIDREKEREDNTKEDNNKEVKHMEINPPREIYDFWRVVLINSNFFPINKKDSLILRYLQDISYIPIEGEFPNFKIEFSFRENEYFKHEKISKIYMYKKGNRFEFSKSVGYEIEWEDEKFDPSKKKLVIKGGGKEKRGRYEGNEEGREKESDKSKGRRSKRYKKKEESKERNDGYVLGENDKEGDKFKIKEIDSFFNIFKKEKCSDEGDREEANFFYEDLLPNCLEYYLDIMDIYEKK